MLARKTASRPSTAATPKAIIVCRFIVAFDPPVKKHQVMASFQSAASLDAGWMCPRLLVDSEIAPPSAMQLIAMPHRLWRSAAIFRCRRARLALEYGPNEVHASFLQRAGRRRRPPARHISESSRCPYRSRSAVHGAGDCSRQSPIAAQRQCRHRQWRGSTHTRPPRRPTDPSSCEGKYSCCPSFHFDTRTPFGARVSSSFAKLEVLELPLIRTGIGTELTVTRRTPPSA